MTAVPSSPTMPSLGRAARRRCVMSCSDARSIWVTRSMSLCLGVSFVELTMAIENHGSRLAADETRQLMELIMECGHVSSFLRSRSVVVCHSSMARKVSTETIATPADAKMAPVNSPTPFQTVQSPVHCSSTNEYPIMAPQAPLIRMAMAASARARLLGSADGTTVGLGSLQCSAQQPGYW